MKYRRTQRHRRFPLLGLKQWLILGVVAVGVLVLIIGLSAYNAGLKPVSSNPQNQIFNVESGDTVSEIAANLSKQHLIRSAWALEMYVHIKHLSGKLQAGTYAFSESQGTKSIVTTLTRGKVATRLVTILPGRRIDQVRADLINDGFSPESVDQALDPAQYADLPVLAYKPANVSTLEGLLWPDSYQKDVDTTASTIVREALQAMNDHLTPAVQADFTAEGLSTYQGIILASIVVQEVNKPADQAQAAQVFMTRFKQNMTLGSDVTARYGAIQAGKTPSLNYDSPYNTLLHTGLPPGPISSISASSLSAALHPANTNWLYFVAGDDGNTYFSHTYQEHQALTQKYCHKLCGD